MKRINIFIDKSPASERNADLLARGIKRQDSECDVQIKDLAATTKEATLTDYDRRMSVDTSVLDADALLFPTSGCLSVFEKHYLGHTTNASSLLEGKKYGLLMTSKTTFDGPTPTEAHQLDNKLIERLAQQGLSHLPVTVERADDETSIEKAGERFAMEAFLAKEALIAK